jgi:DNA-binding NarL/FixJ family response regulator
MIENFKNIEMRNSGVIYNSILEQIKQLHAVDPEQAGEFAISAIELVLTGEVSTDDVIIQMMLTPMKKINENNVARYETKVENAKQKKIAEMKLDKIADLMIAGLKQREIGERLGISQQNVSYRVRLIKQNYPELLQKK